MKKNTIDNLKLNGFETLEDILFDLVLEDVKVCVLDFKFCNMFGLIMYKMIEGKYEVFFSDEYKELNEVYDVIESELTLDFGFERI